MGRVRQQYIEHTTSTGPNGQALVGDVSAASSQGIPVLNVPAGFRWQHANIFIGYLYEYWWCVGEIDNINNGGGSFGEVADQGFVLRAEFHS